MLMNPPGIVTATFRENPELAVMIQIPVPRRGGPGKEAPLPYRSCFNKPSECACVSIT